MNPTLDYHDQHIREAVSAAGLDCDVAPLNPDKPDFIFQDLEGNEIGVSMKHGNELSNGLAAATEQLQRDAQTVSRLYLLVTNPLVPAGKGTYILEGGVGYKAVGQFYKGKPFQPYNVPYQAYRKWLLSASLHGIETIEVVGDKAQADALVALYRWHNDNEHSTFDLPIRSKLVRKMRTPNPLELTLMGLVDSATGRTFTGPVIAMSLASRFSSIVDMIVRQAEIPDVSTGKSKVGPAWTSKFLRAVGAED